MELNTIYIFHKTVKFHTGQTFKISKNLLAGRTLVGICIYYALLWYITYSFNVYSSTFLPV